MNNIGERRLFHIDLLKSVAALMIVAYHFTEFKFLDFGFTPNAHYFPGLGKILLALCSAGVPIFFLINGTVTLNKNYTSGRIIRKILNIAKVYLFWGTLICFFFIGNRYNLSALLSALKNNVWYFWFFKTLAILYVVNFIYAKLPCKKTFAYTLSALLLMFPFCTNFVWLIIRYLHPETDMPSWGHTGFFTLYSILFYFLPLIIPKHIPSWLSLTCIIMGMALNVFEVYVYANYCGILIDNVNGLFPSIGALLISVGIWKLAYMINAPQESSQAYRITYWLGSNSLGIYIFHIPLIIILRHLCEGYLSVVAAVACILIIFASSAVISSIMKRIPGFRWLLKL